MSEFNCQVTLESLAVRSQSMYKRKVEEYELFLQNDEISSLWEFIHFFHNKYEDRP